MKSPILSLLFGLLLSGLVMGEPAFAEKSGGSIRPKREELIQAVKEKTQEGKPIRGIIHGADHRRGSYVFTFVKGYFFNRLNLSMIPDFKSSLTPDILKRDFESLNRGDQIEVTEARLRVRGKQPHLEVVSFQVLKRFNPGVSSPAGKFERSTALGKLLQGKTEIVALVHAIEGEGRVLVLEYKDAVFPMIVPRKRARFSKDLYRGDLVRIQFEVKQSPGRPSHVILADEVGGVSPVTMLDSAKALHGKKTTIEGRLVLFPKSPTINRDIYAIEQMLPGDPEKKLARYFTLVNFTSADVFNGILTRAKKYFESVPQAVRQGRNKYIHEQVRVKATGSLNVVSPNQANAQILMEKAADLERVAP